jgi:hypothetical protein
VVGSFRRFSSPRILKYIAETGSSNGVCSKAQADSQPILRGAVVTTMAGSFQLLGTHKLPLELIQARVSKRANRLDLLQLLDTFRFFPVTKRHDKIYSLLGYAQTETTRLSPLIIRSHPKWPDGVMPSKHVWGWSLISSPGMDDHVCEGR